MFLIQLTVPVLLLSMASAAMGAQITSKVGALNPADPNNVFISTIVLPVTSDVNVQTWGYGGGTNGVGQNISAGGFAPFLALYSGTGVSATLISFSETSACPPGALKTGNCFDVALQALNLAGGSYQIAIGTRGNEPMGTSNPSLKLLSDGFLGKGSYLDPVGGSALTSNYAFDISVTTGTPEPASGAAAMGGVLLLLALKRHHGFASLNFRKAMPLPR